MRDMLLQLGSALAILCSGCGSVKSGGAGDAPGPADAGGPVTITFTSRLFSGPSANAALVGFQDGDAPWQAVTGNAGVYTMTVTHGRYGLLFVCNRTTPNAFTAVELSYRAVSDGTVLFGLDQCTPGVPPTVSISGTVEGTQSGDGMLIDDGETNLGGTAVATWSLTATAGLGTLIAERQTNQRPIGMLFQRVTYADGAKFDLNFANQFFPAEASLTLDPTATNLQMLSTYIDDHGVGFLIDEAFSSVPTYRVVPPDHIGNGISTLTEVGSTTTSQRTVLRAFKTPNAQTLVLPAAFVPSSAPQLTATAPFPIYSTTLPQRDGALYYVVNYSSSGSQLRLWNVLYSAAWVSAQAAGASTLVSQLPDLSTIAGWQASFALPASGVSWDVEVGTGPQRSLPGAAPFGVHGAALIPYQDGDETTTSLSSGQLP